MKSLLNLVGIRYYFDRGNRIIASFLNEKNALLLIRESENPHDPDAIAVYVKIGHIKREQAAQLAPKLDTTDHLRPVYPAKISRNDGGSWIELEIEEPNAHT